MKISEMSSVEFRDHAMETARSVITDPITGLTAIEEKRLNSVAAFAGALALIFPSLTISWSEVQCVAIAAEKIVDASSSSD